MQLGPITIIHVFPTWRKINNKIKTTSLFQYCSPGHTVVWNGIWNGRKKSVWNMEWHRDGMEDLMYRMEQIFYTCAF